MTSPRGHRIVRASLEDRPRLELFLRRHFYTQEPLVKSVGAGDGPPCSGTMLALNSLEEGTSLMAVEKTRDGEEEVVGVCLSGGATKEECDWELNTCCPLSPSSAKVVALIQHISKGGYEWKATGVDKLLDIHVLAVNPDKQRRGLGRALVERACLVAEERGFPAVSMYCTSQYSACLAEKLRMRCVYQLQYSQYLAEDGQPVFSPPPPHVAIKCYVHVMENPGFRIVRASESDRERVVEFLREHFFRFEPLNASLGRPDGPACSGMIVALSSLHEGTSLLAIEESGSGQEEIVGVCLNGESRPKSPKKEFCCPLDKATTKIRALFVNIMEENDIWKETGVEKMLDIHVLAVNSSKRRNGLGKTLVERACLVAEEHGYPAVSMYCTSQYSACLAEKLRMRCVYQLQYSQYLAEDGQPVFSPPPPHVAIKCYVHVFDT